MLGSKTHVRIDIRPKDCANPHRRRRECSGGAIRSVIQRSYSELRSRLMKLLAQPARRTSTALLSLAFIIASQALLFAHADVLERIAAVTKQIEQTPRDCELYLKRGELHRLHRDWKAARDDYDRALEIDPDLVRAYFLRGRMQLEAQNLEPALADVYRFLAHRPNHQEALLTRARIRMQLGERLAAVKDYDRALAQSERWAPEYYLERAGALAAEGDAYLEQALAGLDDAMQELGPIVTLQRAAIDLETRRHAYDEALQRLDQIKRWMTPYHWLYERGTILELAGRAEEAHRAYDSALARIESLPPRRRQSQAMRQLEKTLQGNRP